MGSLVPAYTHFPVGINRSVSQCDFNVFRICFPIFIKYLIISSLIPHIWPPGGHLSQIWFCSSSFFFKNEYPVSVSIYLLCDA
jgi:hypothetical protein